VRSDFGVTLLFFLNLLVDAGLLLEGTDLFAKAALLMIWPVGPFR
jgi:hypothetical protein